MQRWEYRVVSLRPGRYTEALNEYGKDGWELVGVASDTPNVATPERGSILPMPRAFGRLEDAASKLNKLGTGDSAEEATDSQSSVLLWILRRPLGEED